MPTAFDPKFVAVARVACGETGATNLQLAKMFGVCRATVQNWMNVHPEFKAAIIAGRDEFSVATAEQSLIKRVKGFSYTETVREQSPMLPPALLEKISESTAKELFELLNKNLVVTKRTRKHVAPDPTSIIFLLKNRARERWPDTHNIKQSGELKIEGEIDEATRDILERLMVHADTTTDA